MARIYDKTKFSDTLDKQKANLSTVNYACILALCVVTFFNPAVAVPGFTFTLCAIVIPSCFLAVAAFYVGGHRRVEQERKSESERRGGKDVLGMPPKRDAFEKLEDMVRKEDKIVANRYLVGFELDTGEPIWVSDDDMCSHACVFAKTGVGKTLWLEGLMFQQMARGRASGLTFIDAKRDPGTLADIILMALITGRIEDLIVIDPFEPVSSYNFVFTPQRPDVKARKILRCGLPPISDDSPAKHYDRLAADAVYRVVRAMESFGLAWSIRDIAAALSAFNLTYPRLRALLYERGLSHAMIELGHLAGTYRTAKGSFDSAKLTENLRGIASELHTIANGTAGTMFCAPQADLSLTDAIMRGKIVYYMLPRLEEAESADKMVKVFREDLEVAIGEITSNRGFRMEDPHLVMIDEGASTFGPTWANLFELARKGRFALLFGAQSVSGLMDKTMGLSEEFYQRVIANVNLKVIMRLGDNKTAEDMTEWIGKVVTTKKTLAVGVSGSTSAHEWTRKLELNKRATDGYRQGVNFSEDEDDLVSAEELKHEMSAEKGLAWFDIGDGKLRKGRSIWFDGDLPPSWEGRENLVNVDSFEGESIGLSEWVDKHILSLETADELKELGDNSNGHTGAPYNDRNGDRNGDRSGDRNGDRNHSSGKPDMRKGPGSAPRASDEPFRVSPLKFGVGKTRGRVSSYSEQHSPPTGDSPENDSSSKQSTAAVPLEAKPSPEAAPPSIGSSQESTELLAPVAASQPAELETVAEKNSSSSPTNGQGDSNDASRSYPSPSTKGNDLGVHSSGNGAGNNSGNKGGHNSGHSGGHHSGQNSKRPHQSSVLKLKGRGH